MKISIYNLYLLFTTDKPFEFRISNIQTDDILFFTIFLFSEKEEKELKKKKFRMKNKEILDIGKPVEFNRKRIEFDKKNIIFV